MSGPVFEFGEFAVLSSQRQLTRNGAPLETNSRYLDALILMLEHPGQLITRERFLDEVWRGVPVTDEALSQCIANLRRTLGDDASKPRFIETVPKHGYRFVAPVEARAGVMAATPSRPGDWSDPLLLVLAATAGGGLAGLAGGFIYGLGASPDPLQPTVGASSFLIVMLALTALAGALGGFAVGGGMAAAHRISGRSISSTALGAALGGLLVGGAVKLLGTDAFSVLLGKAPAGLGGGFEGLLLGGAVGLGTHLSFRKNWPSVSGSALAGAIAGAIIALLGGRLMAASLHAVSQAFPGSPINMDALGRWVGEAQFGLVAQVGFSAMEGLLFGAAVGAALRYANPRIRG